MTNEEIRQLKAENERLKADKDKYYQQTLDDEIQINELLQTLQEVKEIAKVIDTKECRERRENARKILDLITKAEE